MVPSRFTFTSTSSSDLMDAIALSDVLMPNNAYSSELSQSVSVELRSVVLRYSSTFFSLIPSICPDIHCSSPANLSSALERTRLALKDQSWYSEWFPVYFVNARRHHRICPQLLYHGLNHSDLFLLSLSVSLQGRHHCFQSRDPVDELPVLLLCQNHSCHGCDHNTSSRNVQGPMGSATILR